MEPGHRGFNNNDPALGCFHRVSLGGIGHNRDMTESSPLAQKPYRGVYAVWVAALVATVLIAIIVPELQRAPWLLVAAAGVVLLSFAVQLLVGEARGFILRVAASVFGGLFVMGVISAVLALLAIFTW